MKKFDKKTDQNLVKRSAYALAESTASSTPGLAQAWALSKALYGNALELRQQRALEWVEAISSDPSIFGQKLLSSSEFQDGFVVALEDYIKIRNHLKRRVALKMFREFAASGNKVEFQLERFNDTLLKISTASIQTLAFIKEIVLPLREQAIRAKLATDNMGIKAPSDPPDNGKPYEWWYEQKLKTEPVSTHFDKWITDRYSPNSNKLKNEHNGGKDITDHKLLGELFDIEREVREQMVAPLGELEYLGLIRWGADSAALGWSSTGASAWRLTDFAYEFIAFIEDSPEDLGKNSLLPVSSS